MLKICLASENWAPAHPKVLQAIIEANQGFQPAYGADPWTLEAQKKIQDTFKRKCKVIFVPTGTGANVLGLRLACKRFESVICTDIAHIQYQESGAAESLIGCKLLTVPHQEGKITIKEIQKKLKSEKAFGRHSTSPRVVSISQSTEFGTVYSVEELKAISQFCKHENLLLHVDGSRLYNAVVALGISLAECVEICQPDILSLGGTKNGLAGAEALVIFNESLLEGSDHQQKQTLQLLSKMRFASAQFIPLFEKDLWKELAHNANSQAQKLAEAIQNSSDCKLSYPVETNQLFFSTTKEKIAKLQEHIHCYVWNEEKNEVRFITSWNTTDEEVNKVMELI